MKVRMLVSIAGHAEPIYELGDFSFAPGDEVELHPALAQAWIESGHAESREETQRPKSGRGGKKGRK